MLYGTKSNGARMSKNQRQSTVRIARSLEDLAKVISIRSATYLSEQSCPYDEEFDGNDLCGMHLIGEIEGEPVGSIRIRFFAEFAKAERLAVRYEYRQSTMAFRLVRETVKICRYKGYTRIYGHAQDRLVDFWARFGAKPIEGRPKLVFSDFSYTEMLATFPPHKQAVSLESDGYTLIRPEGEWDRPGILEQSASREVSSPIARPKTQDAR